MSVYISGVEMPKEHPLYITLCPDGSVHVWDSYSGGGYGTQAVPVPEHGDLIDMNAKIDVFDRWDDDIIRPSTVRHLINEYIAGGYPRTIIPAE